MKPELNETALPLLIQGLLLSPLFAPALLPTPDPSTDPLIAQIIVLLLGQTEFPSPTMLIERYFDVIVRSLPMAMPYYECQPVAWLLLSALVCSCPRAVVATLDTTMAPILIAHLHPSTNPSHEGRICALSLIHTLMSTTEAQNKISELSITTLIDSMSFFPPRKANYQSNPSGAVVPNLVWSTGLTAASTRKAALAALHGLLRLKATSSLMGKCHNYTQSAVGLLPALQTSLGDHDTSSREIALSCLNALFESLPPACLEHHQVSEFYPALIKRLDDSFDAIRLDVCSTFAGFTKVAGPDNLIGAPLEYCTEHFLVHLDDPNVKIQDAILRVLGIIASLSPCATATVKRKISDASASHRDPEICSRLLAQIETLGVL